MIDKLYINVAAEEVYTRAVVKTVAAKGLVIEIVIVHETNMVAWVDGDNIRSVLVQVAVVESGISYLNIVSVV